MANHACDEINLNASELVELTKEAATLYWNTVNTSGLHLNVVGKKDVNSAFKTEGVCDVIFEGGGCQINSNLMPQRYKYGYFLKGLSWAGFTFLLVFSFLFISNSFLGWGAS